MSDIRAEKVVFGGRFELVRELGRGSQGITYLARELGTGKLVAVKKLVVGDGLDLKGIELFEREGRVLKSLRHPGIPRYIDAFHEVDEDSGDERFLLVQAYVEGESLGTLIGQGLRMDEAGTRDFLTQMLEILVYLHGLEPAVIHRDIKPSNIMQRADGRWVLIDFGGVQVSAGGANVGASTVVGTSGYMPFEQLVGRAVAASDLYALGATVVHLLSHRHPGDLPVDEGDHMRLLFGDFVTTSELIEELLEGMLEPLWEDRIGCAQFALDILGGNIWADNEKEEGLVMASEYRVAPPRLGGKHRKIKLGELDLGEIGIVSERSAGRVRFEVTRRGSAARAWEHEEYLVAMIGLLGVWITAMRAFFLYAMPSMGVAFGVGAVCSVLVAGLYKGWMGMRRSLEVEGVGLAISGPLFGIMKRRVALDRIYDVRVVPKRKVRDAELGYVLEFLLDGEEGEGSIVRFGSGQTLLGCEWMAGEVSEVIDHHRGTDWFKDDTPS